MSEEKYIEGLRRGSYDDFKALYDRYSSNLYGFAITLTRSESVAKDIVQDTFLKVWSVRENIRTELSFKSFLFTIARNRITDEFRRRMNNPVFEDYLDYCDRMRSTGNNIESRIDFDIFSAHLEQAKSKLSSRQRQVFEMNKEQGIPPGQIARLFNVSEQTVYNQLSSAMRILKEAMGPMTFIFTLFFE